MNLRHLEYFLVLASSESYGQAANNAFISKSTLSQAIKNLEKELGTKLVLRDRGGFRLTAAGRALVAPAEELVRQSGKLTDALKEASGNTFFIGIADDCDPLGLISELDAFRKQYPEQFRVEFAQSDYASLRELVRERKLDFGYCVRGRSIQQGFGLSWCEFGECTLYCMVKEDDQFADLNAVTPRDVVQRKIVPLNRSIRAHIERFASLAKVDSVEMADRNVSAPCAVLKVLYEGCVFIDQYDWSRQFSGLVGVPIAFESDAVSESMQPVNVIYRKETDESTSTNRIAQAGEDFWSFLVRRYGSRVVSE